MPIANVTLSYTDLRRWKACKSQLDQAREMFGDSVTLTRAVLLRAAHAGLDVHWLAPRLLLRELLLGFPLDRAPTLVQDDFYRAMASALAAFYRATDSAQADFDRAIASAQADFDRTTTSAQADFDRAVASAHAEFDPAIASAYAEFDPAMASAHAEFYRAIASASTELSVVAATVLAEQLHLPDA